MMESVLRHRAVLAAIASTLVLGVAVGCGTDSAKEPKPLEDKVQSDNQDNKDTTDTEADVSEMPTVKLSRSGGVAGHMDQLIIAADGSAKLSSRGADTFSCTVEPKVLEGIAKNSTNVPEPKLREDAANKRPVPDQINHTLKISGIEVDRDKLAKGDSRWEALFLATGRVLTSATALRDGSEPPPGGMACTK